MDNARIHHSEDIDALVKGFSMWLHKMHSISRYWQKHTVCPQVFKLCTSLHTPLILIPLSLHSQSSRHSWRMLGWIWKRRSILTGPFMLFVTSSHQTWPPTCLGTVDMYNTADSKSVDTEYYVQSYNKVIKWANWPPSSSRGLQLPEHWLSPQV